MRQNQLVVLSIGAAVTIAATLSACEGSIGENVGGSAGVSTSTGTPTGSGTPASSGQGPTGTSGSGSSNASGTGSASGTAATTASATGSSTTDAASTAATTDAATTASTAATTSSSNSSSASGGPLDCTDPTGNPPALTLTLVADNLSSPVLVKSAPDDPDRLYVVEQSGQVLVIENGVVLATPFIDVSSSIRFGGEEGLLGLAFHPDYAQNGRFFLHYSASGNGDSTVTEFARSANPLVGDDTPVATVLDFPTTEDNHNGGALEFGADGYLYISLGDGGTQDDPECDAQYTSSPPGDPAIVGPNYLGKILRVDVDSAGFPAAPGNPGASKIFHSGFRNPWRMSFDACTGDLFVGDVGQDAFEEIDRITPAQGAQNCGWPYLEGNAAHASGACPAQPSLLAPVAAIAHNPQGNCAIAGGYVYRGSAMPGLRGSYFFGDFCSGNVWMMQGQAGGGFGAAMRVQSLEIGLSISGFGEDGRGNVYVVNLGGDVYRIDPD